MDLVDHPTAGNQVLGFRFPGLTIPQGATITNATIQFTCGSITNAAPTAYTTRVETVDNAVTFSTNTYDITSRTQSVSSVTWNANPWSVVNEAGLAERTPDLSSLVQTIVSRPGWNSGNAISFLFSGHGWRTLCTVDGTPASAALLYVAWTSGAAPASNSVNRSIAATNDDARETISTGTNKLDSSSLDIAVHATEGPQYDAFRFTGLTIPHGANITTSYVQFVSYNPTSTVATLTVKGQAIDNAPTFSGAYYDISSRSTTAASTAWNPPAWGAQGEATTNECTPNISTIVQEIVNRPGWSSGNAIALIFSGSGTRTVYTYDKSPSQAAQLYVAWSTNTGPQTTNSIVATAGPNGSISPSGTVPVLSGGSQMFTISGNTGYHVTNVVVDGSFVGTSNSYTFVNVTTNHSINALFGVNHCTITATADSNGSISPSGAVDVMNGANQTFTISGNTGYHVTNVVVDGSFVGASNSYTFVNVMTNHSINAFFGINHYTITASAGANGSINPSGPVDVTYGGSQAFTITGSTGYHVLDVTVDSVSVGPSNSYTFTSVSASHTIAVTFAINHYTITASAGANGSISPIGSVDVTYGGSQAFTITGSTGYHVLDVTVDSVSVGPSNSYTFTSVSASHTIAATFTINHYTITASAGPNGTITPSGPVDVTYGGSQAFTVTPNTGYHVTNVVVDGGNLGATNAYTFSSLAANHTIAAYFGINHYTITATAGANGSINPSGPVDVVHGTDCVFTFTPSTNCQVTNVTVDGSSIATTNTYTFISVANNHTINVLFGGQPRSLLVVSPYGTPAPPVGSNMVAYGSSMICSAAGSPVVLTVDTNVDGFESGDFSNWAWTNSGTAGWVVQSVEKNSGTYAAKAGSITHNGSSTLELTMVCTNGNIVFSRKVSSELNYDALTFYIDGAQQDKWSGEVGWGRVSYPVTAGTHVFRWTYAKDDGGSLGSDTAWIDDVGVPVSAIGTRKNCTGWSGTGSVPASGSGTNTALLTITQDSSITWIWSAQYLLDTGAASNGSVDVADAWYNANAIATITATASNGYRFGGWAGDVPAAKTNDNPLALTMDRPRTITAQFRPMLFDITVASTYGTPTPPVGITSVASNSTLICSVAGSPISSLLETNVDGFETGNLTRWAWTNSGDAGWVVQSGETNSGMYAAKAGLIGNLGNSTLELTMACTNGNIVFSRRVSSEQNYDWLTFYIDGAQQARWSGNVAWSQLSYAVTAGTHVFRWTYSKDDIGSNGSDTAWIDDVGVPVCATTTVRTCTGWTGSGSVPASGTLTNTALLTITKDSSITWNWRTQYWLQTAAASNGTMNVSSGWMDAGTSVTFIATASNNYRFGGWIGDVPAGNTNDNPLVLTMDHPRSITAQFKPLLYYITVASAYGTPTPPVGITSMASNSTVICSVAGSPVANAMETNVDGFETGDFSKWAWTNSGTAGWVIQSAETNSGMYAAKAGPIGVNGISTLELTMACTNGNIVFSRKVSSEQNYDLLMFYIDGAQQGYWSGEVGWSQVSYPVTAGTHVFRWTYAKDEIGSAGSDTAWIDDVGVPVQATTMRRTCTGWSGTGNVPASGAGTNTALLTMTRDSSITWNWVTQYWLQTAAASNGTVNVSSGWLDSGTSVTITATANGGYHFFSWSGDVTPVNMYDNPLVLTMDHTRTITANFMSGTAVYFTITATAGANGSIAPTGVVSVLQGTSRNFVITPASGSYSIADVLVDGSSVGAVPSYMFTNVINNHTINATFTASTTSRGTPVQWLISYGITNNYDVQEALDPDHDGGLTWEEYIMGTNPTNGNSKLAIIITNSSSRTLLLCQTIPTSGSNYVGKTRYYSMQDSTNISAPGTWQWIANYTNILGDGSLITYTNASPGTRRWFRIKARLQ